MRQHVSHRIVVLGASGQTGRSIVEQARERGHDVVAVVRRSGALPAAPGLAESTWLDVRSPAGLVDMLRADDVVVSALGGAPSGPTTVCADGIRSTIAAMRSVGARRLLAVSAHGVGDSTGRSLYSRAVWSGVPARMRDKEAMEAVISSSDLDWTIVRPPRLTSRARARYRAATDLPIRLWSAVDRAGLAVFLLDEIERPRFVRAFPRIRR